VQTASFLVVVTLLVVGFLYVQAEHPELLVPLEQAKSVLTPAPETSDSKRRRNIDKLLISDANKQDLRDGRVFWGAPPPMADLAYGQAPLSLSVRKVSDRAATFLRYNRQDGTPVILEMQDESLTCLHQPKSRESLCAPNKSSIYASYPYE